VVDLPSPDKWGCMTRVFLVVIAGSIHCVQRTFELYVAASVDVLPLASAWRQICFVHLCVCAWGNVETSETGESANCKYVNLKTLVNQWIVNMLLSQVIQ